MTVYIEKPSLNLREELASLRNQGGYEERQFYFDGLVTNGTFDADTDWTKDAGWTIGSGVATKVTTGASVYIYQLVTLTAGKTYQVSYDITDVTTSGTLRADFIGGTSVIGTSNGTVAGSFSEQLVAATGNNTIRFVGSASFQGSIDNVSVYETDGTDVVHRMPKGWVPLHVYEDGLLQREGSANDYEVVYDGFDYYVKPAVAPSATTQTCVIGVRK